jgi:Helix-turn-helix.
MQKEKISELFKDFREKNGFSQEKMARDFLSISKRQLIRIENAEAIPSADTLLKLLEQMENYDIIKFVREDNHFTSAMKKIHQQLNDPISNLSSIRNDLSDIYDADYYSLLTKTEKADIDLVQCFIDYKETGDEKFFTQIFKTTHSIFFEENLKIATVLLIGCDAEEIIKYLKKIEKMSPNFVEDKRKIVLYLNGVGLILEKTNDSKQLLTIFNFFELLDKLIFSNPEFYYFLPIYYRHLSMYYKKMGSNKYIDYISKAKKLSKLYKNDSMFDKLGQDFPEHI